MPHNIAKSLLLVVVFLFVVTTITGCGSQNTVGLPSPETKCQVDLSWHGLIPGQSTREEVVKQLGKPAEKGKLKFGDKKISYYAYKVNGGEISKYGFDRIFFRPDGVIDWMEIIEADRNGKFETVFETVLRLENTVDVVYTNNNYRPDSSFYDVLGGPDQIYVWAECGLALDALYETYGQPFQVNVPECDKSTQNNLCNLISRYPNPYNIGGDPSPAVSGIVLMKFYFQPTSYNGFTDFYMYKIPYGTWDEFLDNYGK